MPKGWCSIGAYLEYATIVTHGDLIRPEHLRLGAPGSLRQMETDEDRITLSFTFSHEDFSLEAVHREVTEWALEKCNKNKSAAARPPKATRKVFY